MKRFLIAHTDPGACAPLGLFDRDEAMDQIEKLTEKFSTHRYYLAEIEGEYAREIGPVVRQEAGRTLLDAVEECKRRPA